MIKSGIYRNTHDTCHYRVSAEVYLNETYVFYIECLDSKTGKKGRSLLNHKDFSKQLGWNIWSKVEESEFEETPIKYHTIAKPDKTPFYFREKEVKKKRKGKALKVTKTKIKTKK